MAKQEGVFGSPVVTPKGRLSFFDVDTPNTAEKHPKNQYPSGRYDVTLMIAKDVDLSALKAECDKVAKEAFKTLDGVDMPFANGDEKSLASMKGSIIVRAKSTKKPGCVDGSKARITEAAIEAGMWGRMQITPLSYVSGRSKGVTFVLKNVQVFTEQSFEPLSGGASAESAFDDDESTDGIDAF